MIQELTQKQKEFFQSHGVNSDEITRTTDLNIDGMYSIYDICTGMYEAPFLASNDQVAIRTVRDIVMFKDTMIKRHPEDYRLFYVGSYNKSLGMLIQDKQRMVCNFTDLIVPLSKSTPSCADDLDPISTK